MKKFVLVLFVICAFIGSAFATTQNDSVLVKATVGKISVDDAIIRNPGEKLYQLFGGLNGAETADSSEVDTSKSIDEEDVVVYFRVYQNLKLKTDELVTLTVDVGPFYGPKATTEQITAGKKDTTALPTISDIKAVPYTGYWTVTPSQVDESLSDKRSFTFTVDYEGIDKPVEDHDVGYFTAKWTHDDALVEGEYSASITLTLTAE